MAVATFLLPVFDTQSAAVYKAAIDGDMDVLKRTGDAFAPHEEATPVMKVELDAGMLFDGSTLTEKTSQSTATITAPTGNPRG